MLGVPTRPVFETLAAVLLGAVAGGVAALLPVSEFLVPGVVAAGAFLATLRGGVVPGLLTTLAGAIGVGAVRHDQASLLLIGPLLAGASGVGLGWARQRAAGIASPSELATFDAIPLSAILYDPPTQRILHANRAAIAYFGYSAADFRGMTLSDMIVPDEVPKLHGYLDANAHKETRQIRWRLRRRDGEIGEFEVLSTAVVLRGRALRLVMGIDLANYRKLVTRLKKAQLETREAKSQFLAVVGHELRTPLTAVVTAVQALEAESLTRSQRQLVETIRRNVDVESRLVEDMLDFIRSERRSLRLDTTIVDVHEVIRHAIETCQGDLARGRQRLVVEMAAESPLVQGDAARLQQVFWNLLRNASKFTPAGGEIRICTFTTSPGISDSSVSDPSSDPSVESTAMPLIPVPGAPAEPPLKSDPQPEPMTPVANHGRLIVEVSDTGVGIEREELERIFDPFAQGQTTRRLWSEGLGLGLAISRAIAEAQGGRLTARSAGPGLGSTFRLELARAEAQAPVSPSLPQDEALRPLEILLVDDSQDIRFSLSRLLRLQEHRVTVAGDVAGALKALKSRHFDLLISDLDLPDGTGHELLRAVRNGSAQSLPAIALSGYDATSDRTKSREAGFALHLAKPVRSDRLNEAIRIAMRSVSR